MTRDHSKAFFVEDSNKSNLVSEIIPTFKNVKQIATINPISLICFTAIEKGIGFFKPFPLHSPTDNQGVINAK